VNRFRDRRQWSLMKVGEPIDVAPDHRKLGKLFLARGVEVDYSVFVMCLAMCRGSFWPG
jgi:hypothetical protein